MCPTVLFCRPSATLDEISLRLVHAKHSMLWERVLDTNPEIAVDTLDAHACNVLYATRSQQIEADLRRYAMAWNRVSSTWFELMRTLFRTVRSDVRHFMAHVTVLPLYVRDLETHAFLVPLGADHGRVLEVCAHEICHFYFYEALVEVLPTERQTIFTSRQVWLVSEMLVPLLFGIDESQALLGTRKTSTYVCSVQLLDLLHPVFDRWHVGQIATYRMFLDMNEIINDHSNLLEVNRVRHQQTPR